MPHNCNLIFRSILLLLYGKYLHKKMENFIVSARKYRPSSFDLVVGQQNITTTLKNAIHTKHLAHAYLFSGSRGVGKTTCARIFAKTINCQNLSPEIEACNECESCKAFNENRSYNIHELDAASNNSVEDIRSLIDKVRIPPQIGTHSVYIIDEVHMLSSSAFNAFLKTLEEPPKHAIFILATTEKHKILPTILSRCQIFDFNRIKVEDIAGQLSFVATREKIEAEAEALHIIAQKANGGMRDALSFFDQIVSFSGKKITYQQAIDNLNVLDYTYYFRLVDAFLNANIAESLLIFNEILNKGFDGHHFVNGLSSHFRDLMVSSDAITLELLEVGSSLKERYKQQAAACTPAFIFHALAICNACDIGYKNSQNQRLHVELALLQLCNLSPKSTFAIQQTQNTQAAPTTQVAANIQNAQGAEKKKLISSPKISDVLNNKINPLPKSESNVPNANPNIVTEETPVTPELVTEKWAEILQSMQQRPRFAAILNNTTPIFTPPASITLNITKIQHDSLVEIRDEIIIFLRTKLRNKNVQLAFNIIETTTETKKIYTTQDKLNYLMGQNQNLNDLRTKFNLDLN